MKRLSSQTELAELLVILYILTILVHVVFALNYIRFQIFPPSSDGRYSRIDIQDRDSVRLLTVASKFS